jgi:hypothetical protein
MRCSRCAVWLALANLKSRRVASLDLGIAKIYGGAALLALSTCPVDYSSAGRVSSLLPLTHNFTTTHCTRSPEERKRLATMLIPKADRKAIHEYLFKEGVLVAKKDYNLPKHGDIDTKNLYVRTLAMGTSLKNTD